MRKNRGGKQSWRQHNQEGKTIIEEERIAYTIKILLFS